MKRIILFFSLVMLYATVSAQYTNKAQVISAIDSNVKNNPAVLLRADTLNKILNGLANFAGTPFKFGLNDTVMSADRYINTAGHKFIWSRDGNMDNSNMMEFGSRYFETYFSAYDSIYGQNPKAALFINKDDVHLFQKTNDVGTNIELINGGFDIFHTNTYGNQADLNMNGNAVTIRRNNGVAKNIITSINSAVADSTGNIDIASGGGAPMRFGIEDAAMGQDRYVNMPANQWYYDMDGNYEGYNYLNFGGSTQKKLDITFSDPTYYGQNPNKQKAQAAELFQRKDFVDISSYTSYPSSTIYSMYSDLHISDSTISLQTQAIDIGTYNMRTAALNITPSIAQISQQAVINGNATTTIRNIVTSINNQLADINGNINTAQFTIAQRDAMPVPSAGFTAFITDAVSNISTVGVNQSWDGMAWRNNW